MPVDCDIQDKLGEVIGLAQAVRRMVRQVSARVGPETELELAQFAAALEDMQRRCESFVATQSWLKQSRVTARAREIKVSVASHVSEHAGTTELLTLLTLAANDALVRWRGLGELAALEPNTPMSRLVSSAILLHEGHVQELGRHLG